jgi:hypothetical protein
MASSDDAKQVFPRAHILLEYLRILIWPLLVIMVAFAYRQDIMRVVDSREIKVGPVEVGRKLEDLKDKTKDELETVVARLERIEATATNTPDNVKRAIADVRTSVDAIQDNYTKESQLIQQQIATPPAPLPVQSPLPPQPADQTTVPNGVQQFEEAGFRAIKERKLTEAIDAFAKAESVAPSFHNVAEIHALLRNKHEQLAGLDPDAKKAEWKDVDRTILNKYSWGMPKRYRAELQRSVGQY